MENEKQIRKTIATLRTEYSAICEMQRAVIRLASMAKDEKISAQLFRQVERLDKTAWKYFRMLKTMKKHYIGYYITEIEKIETRAHLNRKGA